jgi:hypothetical protein
MRKLTGMGVGLLLAVLFSACGGGGGGGGNDGGGGDIGVALQPLAIDATNAMQVAAAVTDASALVVDVGAPGGPITGVAVEGNSAQVDLAQAIRAQLDLFSLVRDQAALGQVAGVSITDTFNCDVNGTVEISAEVADPQFTTLTPGDTLSMVFKNCDDGDGLVLNGTMAFEVVSSTGTIDSDPASDNLFLPPYNFTFEVTLTNLSVTEAGSTSTTNGDLTWTETTTDGIFFVTDLSGDSLSITTSETTDTLEDYLIKATFNQTTTASTTDSGGDDGSGATVCCATLASTALGGTVDFDTTQPFAGVVDNFPGTGQMDITGATVVTGNLPSNITVSVVDSQCVHLLVDADGDGFTDPDGDIFTTWQSLPTGIPDSSLCP